MAKLQETEELLQQERLQQIEMKTFRGLVKTEACFLSTICASI